MTRKEIKTPFWGTLLTLASHRYRFETSKDESSRSSKEHGRQINTVNYAPNLPTRSKGGRANSLIQKIRANDIFWNFKKIHFIN